MNFTLDQQKAHDPTRHLSITANAGSGKTRVLVSRYCDLVELHGFSPDRIAAITFTEKAASELRTRIAIELERRLSDDAHKQSWKTLKLARERFPSALVTTIHGFCSQLLREFPIEANVPPNFSILTGYERRRLEKDALLEAIESALDDGYDRGEESAAFRTARRIGRETMESVLQSMMARRETIEYSRHHGILAADRDHVLDTWDRALLRLVRGLALNADTVPAIDQLVGKLKQEPAESVRQCLGELHRAATLEELMPPLDTLFSVLLTRTGSPRKNSYDQTAGDIGSLDAPAARVAAAYARARPFLEADADPECHRTLYDDARVLLGVHEDAVWLYDRRKRDLNALDFEDLQLRLLQVLEQPSDRERIVGRFGHIMVDEFQDTNELQYAIVRHLLDGFRAGRLCIVGDEKQSIYGFRNAEVEVFRRATRDISVENREAGHAGRPLLCGTTEIEPATRDEDLGVISLDASFRLLPSICAFVNATCSRIMRADTLTALGVDYEPLVCARGEQGDGRVELILARPEPKAGEDDAGWCSEADMVARRILRMVAGDLSVWGRTPAVRTIEGEEPELVEVDEERTATFGDIAILCRKRRHFPAIERALRTCGVPFVAHGSVGFYRTQEIYDAVNYLRALMNERDDVALVGVLRSPYFCVSDAELYRMSIAKSSGTDDGRHLWARAVRRAAAPTAEPALVRAVDAIAEDRAMAGRIPVSLLMRRVLERSGWRGATVGSDRGEQALANIDKLMSMAREFEGRGFTNLFDFVERLTELIDSEEMEGEASVNTGRDAVHIMTMHAAKGLEFPVVILPSLHATTPPASKPYFDKELGFGWTWRFQNREHRPMITALMALRESERERTEEARLFYVAATRARDALILSGEFDPDHPPKNSMLAWSLAPFGDVPSTNTTLVLPNQTLRFLEPDGRTVREAQWELPVVFHRDIEDSPRHEQFEGDVLPLDAGMVAIGELPARAEGEIYSATQFLAYDQCPTKYYLRYRLGIPEAIAGAYDVDADGRDTDDGTTFARLFRTAARSIDAMREEDDPLAPASTGVERQPLDRITAVVDEVLALEPILAARLPDVRRRLIDAFTGILSSSEALAVLFPEGTRAVVEQELRIPFGREYLRGVIDRMLVAVDGTVEIVHYKTIRVRPENVASVARSYLPQLRLYAWLAGSLLPEQTSVTATLVFVDAPDAPQAFVFPRFDMTRIEEELRVSIEGIRTLTYTGRRELPLRSDHCPLCPYWIGRACLLAGTADRHLS